MDWRIFIAFAAGLASVVAFALVMKLKTRGVVRVAVNSCAGGALIFALSFFGTALLPLNILSALATGILGLPGLAAVFLITRFL